MAVLYRVADKHLAEVDGGNASFKQSARFNTLNEFFSGV